MARHDLSQTVVVLDLDDTLYTEADYRASGLRAVCAMVNALMRPPKPLDASSRQFIDAPDPLALICKEAALPASLKETLLWVYRLHTPDIHLSPAVARAVAQLEASCHAVAVLTDGRAISQRQKLKALGLSHLPAYISEDYASCKPAPLRFQKVMSDFPAKAYVYVGDNPLKDFVAPNALQWETVGLRGGAHNIHSQGCDGLPAANLPNRWVSSMDEFLESLC
jgi:putative hydrolase of the HAD superfamily